MESLGDFRVPLDALGHTKVTKLDYENTDRGSNGLLCPGATSETSGQGIKVVT